MAWQMRLVCFLLLSMLVYVVWQVITVAGSI